MVGGGEESVVCTEAIAEVLRFVELAALDKKFLVEIRVLYLLRCVKIPKPTEYAHYLHEPPQELRGQLVHTFCANPVYGTYTGL